MSLPKKENKIYEKELWWLPDEQIKEIIRLGKKIEILENNIFYLISIIGSLAAKNNFKDSEIVDVVSVTANNKTQICPQCGSPMILREGKYGSFWGCSKYPNCRKTIKIVNSGKSTVGQILTSIKNNVYLDKKSVAETSIKLPWEDEEKLNNDENNVEEEE